MAVSAIAKVLIKLFHKHGVSRGISMAQKLGFKNKDIKSAFSKLGVKRRRDTYPNPMTFQQRKAERNWYREMAKDDRYIPAVKGGDVGPGMASRKDYRLAEQEAMDKMVGSMDLKNLKYFS